MKIEEIKNILKAELLWGDNYLQKEITMVCAADLMSDVLTSTKSDSVLLTGLTNLQVIHTAEIVDIVAICFVRGKKPPKETIKLAKEKEIPLLTTKFSMYEACGRLYKTGLIGCNNPQ